MDRRLERVARSLAAVVSRRGLVNGVAGSAALGVVGLPKPAPAAASSFGAGRAELSRASPAPTGTFPPASQPPRAVALPTALQGVPLDPQSGFDLPNGRFRATFVPRAGLVGPQGQPEALLREPMVVGMVISCLQDVWWIESEPATGSAFNLVLYRSPRDGGAGRQAVMTGQGMVGGANGAGIDFSVQTLPSAPRLAGIDPAQASGTIRSDGSTVGTFGGEYCRKNCHDHCGKNWSHKHCRKHCDRKCS